MSTPQSCPKRERLKQMLDGTIPHGELSAITEHVEACGDCQNTLESLSAGHETMLKLAVAAVGDRSADGEALRQVMQRAKADIGIPNAESAGSAEDEELILDFLNPPDTPEHLGRLNDYEVVEIVGRGGMGVVFKALDRALDRTVAIKVMSPYLAASASARKRFRREAQAAAAVAHDHVITIHAVEEKGGLPYIVMQLISGCSLSERIDRDGALQVQEILRIGKQTAEGLAAAHEQGLVHRDIKPGNILLENGVERVRITDFGLARALDDASLTQSGVITGTPQFMSPEQARGEPPDQRSDLFSLGSVFYMMCTGRAPFRASTSVAALSRVTNDVPRPIREINEEIPKWLVEIVGKLHEKDPDERFQTAQEVADLMAGHLAHLQQPERAPRPARIGPTSARGAVVAGGHSSRSC